jgi:peptide/nickel transport system substrate-binding protein
MGRKGAWVIRTLVVTIVVVVAVAVGAGAAVTGAAAKPKSGGTITFGGFQEPASLDPVQSSTATGTSGAIELAQMYDTIMRFDAKTGKYLPQTAESLTPSADYMQWTLVLKPNIDFQDGTDYDAAAVVSNLDRHFAPTSRSTSRGYAAFIKSYTATGPLTVEFTMSQAWPGFPVMFTDYAGMLVSPTALATLGAQQMNTAPVKAGAGPFMFESYKPKESLVLTKNPNYFDPPVYLDGMTFTWVPGFQATYDQLNRGLQCAFIRDPDVEAQAKKANLTVIPNPVQSGGMILMNNAAGHPTSDVNVRKAIAAAIDTKAVNARVFNGTAQVGTEFLQSSFPYYPGVPGPKFDTKKAKKLVAQAKDDGWNGEVRYSFVSTDPLQQNRATLFQAMLANVGVTLVPEPLDPNTRVTRVVVAPHDFDMTDWGLSTTADDSGFLRTRNYFFSTSPGNFESYSNPAMDAALNKVQQASTPAEKKAAWKEVAQIYTDDQIGYSYAVISNSVVCVKDVRGVVGDAQSSVHFDKASVS